MRSYTRGIKAVLSESLAAGARAAHFYSTYLMP
ncbi:hypothetical protein EDD76_11975 [Kineothrix alysoides]|uniref:Uncharacterized protein n=1 Tax=Kineothrix alysoides TaxID=1469948 RepID=A0A4R1QWE4_9FIRM|nr:hypothetical protein EDD76_11975 [Kineothrix alysoides]